MLQRKRQWQAAERGEDVRVLTSEQLDLFFKAVETIEPAFVMPFRVLAKTGIRIGELVGLQTGDLSLDTREAQITRQLADPRDADA